MPIPASKTLAQVLAAVPSRPLPSRPVWAGPCDAGDLGGITYSLLSRYLADKERFRLLAIEGLKPMDKWTHTLGYGSMWHVCEESLAASHGGQDHDAPRWKDELEAYCLEVCKEYPLQQKEIERWYRVCQTQFPVYVDWWAGHEDVKSRVPLLQEVAFHVPYLLPSGRVAYLRGKWDSVDLIESLGGIWLQENKSKGDIDEPQLKRQLSSGFDLQTQLYLVALKEHSAITEDERFVFKSDIKGVRYNVVRRPLAGGQGSIKQREGTQGAKCAKCRGEGKHDDKRSGRIVDPCLTCGGVGRTGAKPAETDDEFYDRLGGVIRSAEGPEWDVQLGEHYFFQRWKMDVSAGDIARFKRECLDPVLENLCDDYEWWAYCETQAHPDRKKLRCWFESSHRQLRFPEHSARHFRFPYGVYNPLMEGGSTEYDEYLNNGSELGLRRCAELFPELRSNT